jgi:hypothetical protein
MARHFERWARTDFDRLTIDMDIAALQRAGADGLLALVHGGAPAGINPIVTLEKIATEYYQVWRVI